ncbi:heavy metal-associated domain-containing protein [Paracoccaceae bacterium Fryx2]|nr:heavy metal-associated domain-containing protein [Paracoccaceae bacterium Fryx2]
MTTLSIPDMTCGHCRASVEQALGAVPGVGHVSVDLPGRTATIEGAAPVATLIAALEAVGFPAEVAG